jgi:O-antigen ligase
MSSSTLVYPLRAAWKRSRILRGIVGIFGICAIAVFTVVVLGLASIDLFQFLLGCAIFFAALILARPLSGRTIAGERAAFLSSALVIWVFLMVSEVMFSHPQSTATAARGDVALSAVFQAISWILSAVVLALFTFFRPAYIRRLFAGPLKWASIFAIVAVISCSLSPKPSYSAALAFKLCVIVLTVCAMGEAIEDEKGITKLFAGMFLGTLIVVTKAFVTPLVQLDAVFNAGGGGGRLPMVGLSGAAGVLLLLCLLFFFIKKNLLFLMLAIYATVVIMVAGNKGGMVASFVSLMMFFVLLKRPAQALAVSFGFSFILALAMLFTPLGHSLEKYGQEGNAGTLTGRTNLWADAWPRIQSHPVLGNGYRASRFLSEDVPGAFQEAGNMHNSFLEVLYNNGVAGLIPIVIINVLIAVNLWGVILRPPTLQLRYYAAATLALQTHLLVWGLVAVTFGGAPDDRFMTFLALLLVSMFLRGRSDKKYWKKIYGDHVS